MSFTILQLKSVAVVKFMTRRQALHAVATSTTIPEFHNVAITTPSNPRSPRALVPESKSEQAWISSNFMNLLYNSI